VLAIGFSTRHFKSDRIMRLEERGVPVLDGLETSFAALTHLHRHQTCKSYPAALGFCDKEKRIVLQKLSRLVPDDENGHLGIIEAAGVPTVKRVVATSLAEALAAAEQIGYPVVAKTAEAVAHKTEVKGVWLDLNGPQAVEQAYSDLSPRLGPRVLIASMVKGGVELALGAVVDPLAGPMVMVAAGGILAELLADRQFALAPVSEDEALDMLTALNISPTLDSYRGKPGIDRQAVARAIAKLSRLIGGFPDIISAIDINPVIANVDGLIAVDALISLNGESSKLETD